MRQFMPRQLLRVSLQERTEPKKRFNKFPFFIKNINNTTVCDVRFMQIIVHVFFVTKQNVITFLTMNRYYFTILEYFYFSNKDTYMTKNVDIVSQFVRNKSSLHRNTSKTAKYLYPNVLIRQ